MKILTTSFLTCAVKTCKSSPASFPLHYRDAELEIVEMAYNPEFLQGILPRLDWDAVKVTAGELGFTVPETKPESPPSIPTAPEGDLKPMDDTPDDATATFSTTDEKVMRDLHTLLMETSVKEGKLVCGNCGHEYRIKEGIANFLLPGHLV